ncbi:MAG: hypothetical protein GX234_07220 [Clostridiales bacterium]|nr:hypothetical protein [Clostridiales bacterium]
MMYIHYCPACHKIHMLNGHKQFCPRCEGQLAELKVDYMTYTAMDASERAELAQHCSHPEELGKISTTYRMIKYSKWYKEMQQSLNNNSTDNRS